MSKSDYAARVLDRLLHQALCLSFQFKPRVLMRLYAGRRCDPLHEIEDAFRLAVFLTKNSLDDLGRLRLGKSRTAAGVRGGKRIGSIRIGTDRPQCQRAMIGRYFCHFVGSRATRQRDRWTAKEGEALRALEFLRHRAAFADPNRMARRNDKMPKFVSRCHDVQEPLNLARPRGSQSAGEIPPVPTNSSLFCHSVISSGGVAS